MSAYIPRWTTPVAHIDADCFFVSCELVRNPSLRGKKVGVVSGVGGMILAKSYEAKACGIKTGTPPWEARKLCPDIIMIKTDFDLYSKLSQQLFSILKEFSPILEERSIDECYLDLKGLRGFYHKSFDLMAKKMQEEVYLKTGLPVSVGIANTKIIAKMASEFNKPMGIKIINGREARKFLNLVPIKDIPGVGPNKEAMLHKFGIKTALDIAILDYKTIQKLFDKQGEGIWWELNGKQIWKVEKDKKPQQSISKTASFQKKSSDKAFVFAELLNNLERATSKLVSDNQMAKEMQIFVRLADFGGYSTSARFANHTNNFNEFAKTLRILFEKIWVDGKLYRSTGIIFLNLIENKDYNSNIFMNIIEQDKKTVFEKVKDEISRKYGKDSITMSSKLGFEKKKDSTMVKFKYPWLGTTA